MLKILKSTHFKLDASTFKKHLREMNDFQISIDKKKLISPHETS